MVGVRQQRQADDRAEYDRRDLAERRGYCERDQCGSDCERCAWPVGCKVSRHAPDRLRDNGHRDQFQSLQPSGVTDIAECFNTVGEGEHQQRGWQREADPGGDHAEWSGAQQADRHAELARCGAGHELAECDEIGETAFGYPAAAFDELRTEIADMRDRATERGAAEAKENAEDFCCGGQRLVISGQSRL